MNSGRMRGRPSVAARWGAFVARRRWAFVAAWLLAFVGMAYLASGTPRLLSPASFEADTEASRTGHLLRQHFPDRRSPVLVVVFQSEGTPVSDPAYQAQVDAWKADLDRLAAETGGAVGAPVPGRDGRTQALLVESNQAPDRFIELGRRAGLISHPGPAHVFVGGPGAVYNNFVAAAERDLQQSEQVSLPLALLLLLLVFGGLVAGLLPVLTGLATVTVTVALLGLVAQVHTVSLFSLNVSAVVGLGLGIDYSLLVVNRFREEMRRGRDLEDAVATTVATAGVATVLSGGTVAIGFGALMLSHLNVLWSMGLGGVLVVAVSVLASLTLIPALLAIAGRRIDSLALPFTRGRDTAPFWQGLASRVMARPALFIVLTLAVVLALLSPARSLRVGIEGSESLPPGDQAARAEQIGRAQLGLPSHPPVLAVASGVDGPALAAEVESRLRLSAGGQPVRGVADVPAAAASSYLRDGYAIFELEQPAGDNDESTHRWLDRVRATSLPPGVRLHLTGQSAAYQDFVDVLLDDFTAILGAVLALTFVLLGVGFRSLLLPLKAVLMNLLSIGAAMGVLTWAFQDGHLASLLDFRPVGFVDATVPVVIFAALFGMSMDYEVFLLSRIREEWRRGRSNADAVATGMERTGQIITSAALILVVVTGTLAFSHLTAQQEHRPDVRGRHFPRRHADPAAPCAGHDARAGRPQLVAIPARGPGMTGGRSSAMANLREGFCPCGHLTPAGMRAKSRPAAA